MQTNPLWTGREYYSLENCLVIRLSKTEYHYENASNDLEANIEVMNWDLLLIIIIVYKNFKTKYELLLTTCICVR